MIHIIYILSLFISELLTTDYCRMEFSCLIAIIIILLKLLLLYLVYQL